MKIDTAIIGGGIVGLWTAKILAENYPTMDIALFESTGYLGHETTTRNSQVLHAGLYYKHGSMKHLTCMDGHRLWRDYCHQKNILLNECGKYLIAAEEAQRTELESLYSNAENNGVQGLRRLDKGELDQLSSYAKIFDGFFCASTAIMNVPDILKSLDRDLEQLGVMIIRHETINSLTPVAQGYKLGGTRETLEASLVFNCAGGNGALALRQQLFPEDKSIENYWIKGHYLKLKGKLYNKALLYPLPSKQHQTLGVHTCIGPQGEIGFGPDAVWTQQWQYEFSQACYDSIVLEVQRNFKNIKKDDLLPDYCGIRPKIKINGQIQDDFYLSTPMENYVEALGIESPGLTAAPAIARRLLKLAHL